jgi:3-dehydroquinate synthase
MAFIAHLSFEMKLISQELLAKHLSVLQGLGLPTQYTKGEWPEVFAAMKLDKKSRGNNLRFVVITEIGKTQRLENPDEAALISAYEKVSQ